MSEKKAGSSDIEWKNAEENKQKGYDDEYRLEEVFQRIIYRIFESDKVDDLLINKITQELIEIELNHEICVSYFEKKILNSLSKYKHEKLCYISDFYMSQNQINYILSALNSPLKFSSGYVSSEFLYNKKSGRLFKIAEKDMQVSPSQHMHIGDSILADIQCPQNMGIHTSHFEEKHNDLLKEQLADNFIHRKEGIMDAYLSEIDIGESLKISTKKRLFTEGWNYSSVFVAFVLEIIEYALHNKIEKVYYCTREGELFKKIHDKIAEIGIWHIELPDTELLEVSRMATFVASLYRFDLKEIERIWTQYHNQSMNEFYQSLDIEIEPYKGFLKKYKIECDENIPDILHDERIVALFLDSEYVSHMREEAERKRKLLKNYMRQKGVEEESTILMVDIGWRGSIQDNIALVYPDKQVIGYYFGIFESFYYTIPNCRKFGFMNVNDTPDYMWCLSYVDPIEMMCNSDSGSVEEYRYDNGFYMAVRRNVDSEDIIYRKYINKFQKGILESLPKWCEIINNYYLMPHEIKGYALQKLERMISNPNFELAKAYFQLCHNELYGKGMIESKKIKLNFRLMLEGVNESRRDEFWQYIRETHWPQGFLKIYGMSCLLKEYNRIVQEEWINIIKSEKTSLCQRVPLAETNLQISEDICYYIEKITEKDNIIKISGWAICAGKDSNQYSIVIGLRNVAESIFYNTLCLYRSDVTLFFSDGHNYDQSGFQCQIDASELDKASYEIMIGMVGKEKVYLLTHQYVELKLNKKYY